MMGFHRWQSRQLARVIRLSVVLSFGLALLPEQPALAQVAPYPDAPVTTIAGNEVQPELNCMHLMIRRTPACRAQILLLFARHWLTTHVRVDTTRWGLPLYVEFDETAAWRQASIFCLHLNRGLP
jgi:hypothetical protein